MNRLPFSLIALLIALAAVSGCGESSAPVENVAKAAAFHCPMHPTYTSDRPGDCPICGMSLVRITGGGESKSAANIPGRVAIVLAPEKRQLIGLTLSTVEKRPLIGSIRSPGVVTHDETRYARIAPRFGGWVKSLQVNFTGQAVQAGEPLFTVYSPELFTAETDYLLALRNLQHSTNSAAAQKESARHLQNTARRKLTLLEVGDNEIKELEERGRAVDELQVRAPMSGHVITKAAVQGQAFEPGEMLYEIADLSHLWIQASVHEADLPLITLGQKATVTFPALGGRAFESSVSFISPHLDPQTRRGQVRLELANAKHELRPEMWATVEFELRTDDVIVIPASAVIDTGTRWVAFVNGEMNHLEPREVKIGQRTDEYFEVLEGIREGEKVVTRALFLVDSESQLKAAISAMSTTPEHQH
ncbi:MAG TPA: efflux RND transporter periplasmic adaptor subunit [Verrucomicrobiae bacterium]|nr:efflux RND transporter periplasmic adaptor subunit [Verrucomicrobiae bacterium]